MKSGFELAALTRRAFTRGGTMFAAAAMAPTPSMGQAPLRVRRSINDLIRENSPLIDSYRRAVDVMMKRDITDKTSWWFQANIHDAPDDNYAMMPSLAEFWGQCPHKNYFFPSWHRIYLHFFERIARKASGDPDFVLPYWSYDDPAQSSLPTAFVPDDDEFEKGEKKAVPPLDRRNPLARAKRLLHVDRRWIGIGDAARDTQAALALDRFTVTDKLDALQGFGGVRTEKLSEAVAAGGLEAAPHNLVHRTMGIEGDLGSPQTAARDPIFWLHHANVDRIWVKWTDNARGRIPPVDDPVWMNTKCRFFDENGNAQEMSAAEVLDTQFDLGYRYADDPPRLEKLEFKPALAPGGAQPKGFMRARTAEPTVLARSEALHLTARESNVALAAPARGTRPAASGKAVPAPGGRLRVVLKDLVANVRTPPYDVFLALDAGSPRAPGSTAVRVGGLDLFGEGGGGAHAAHGAGTGGTTIAFEASAIMSQLARTRGFDLRRLRVAVARRGYPSTAGGEFVPDDPEPLRIGAIELIQS
jgi:Common central domain of tyrosinase/Polyphenol oxidase middle domain